MTNSNPSRSASEHAPLACASTSGSVCEASALQALADAHGGHWGQHPEHPVADWQYEVANDDTRLGYWAWVFDRLEQAAVDDPYGVLTALARIEREHEALLSELEALVPDEQRARWDDELFWDLIDEVKSALGARAANTCSDAEDEQDDALSNAEQWVADSLSGDARAVALLVWLDGPEQARASLLRRLKG